MQVGKERMVVSRIFPRVAARKSRLTLGLGTGFQPDERQLERVLSGEAIKGVTSTWEVA